MDGNLVVTHSKHWFLHFIPRFICHCIFVTLFCRNHQAKYCKSDPWCITGYRNTSQDCVTTQKISPQISPTEDQNLFSWLSNVNTVLKNVFNHNVLQRDGLHTQRSFVELIWRGAHLFDTIFKHYSIQIQSWNMYCNNLHPQGKTCTRETPSHFWQTTTYSCVCFSHWTCAVCVCHGMFE